MPPLAPADSPEVVERVTREFELVRIVARQLVRTMGAVLGLDELEALGRDGLLTAARTFDPDRGVPFRRWANLKIRGAIIDGVRSHGGLPRAVYRRLKGLDAANDVEEALVEEDG